MSRFRLQTDDEFTHPPGPERNFNESVYCNAFDFRTRLGGWMRLGNRCHEGYAELSVCLYLPDGRIACQFQRPKIAGNEAFAAGGLEYCIERPLEAVTMTYAGEVLVLDDPSLLRDPKRLFNETPRTRCEVVWRHHGITEVHGGVPVSADQQTMYGRDFSLGHFNQHTQVSGRVSVGDEEWLLDGFGWRDHSWGPRDWQNILFDRLLIGSFGPERAFMLLKIANRSGPIRRAGVIFQDGHYEEIQDLDIATEWTGDRDPQTIRFTARTRNFCADVRGRVIAVAPLRNRRTFDGVEVQSRIAEAFTEWLWDGVSGYGMAEYVEVVENGIPVGYPL